MMRNCFRSRIGVRCCRLVFCGDVEGVDERGDELGCLVEAEPIGVDTEIVVGGIAPCLARVVGVVCASALVGLHDVLLRIGEGDVFVCGHELDSGVRVALQEDGDAVLAVAEDEVGASPDEDAVGVADEVGEGLACLVGDMARVFAYGDGGEEGVDGELVEEILGGVERPVLLGHLLEVLACVEGDVVVLGEGLANDKASCAALSGYGDDHLLLCVVLWRSKVWLREVR